MATLFVTLVALAIIGVYRQTIVEAVHDFMNRFGGGPPSAMHPSPVNDSHLLRRGWAKKRKCEP